HNKKQKGVDGRIVQDLFELASEGIISDALIVTGDGDLSVGVEFAQRRGVRVAILGIEDIPNGVSPNRHQALTFLADAVLTMGSAEINKYFS
ncbi:NYN domain-containing protein, partial [Bacillus atrophaeus]|uniref:NYN domain-containing protein n=1 Tax=Bacillus atrophaeus TaxID=1452 RepID=UPI001EFBFAC2